VGIRNGVGSAARSNQSEVRERGGDAAMDIRRALEPELLEDLRRMRFDRPLSDE
jgi:hypothetical protein